MTAISLLSIGKQNGLVVVDLSRTAMPNSTRMHYRVTIRTDRADSTEEEYFDGKGETPVEAVEAAISAFSK